MIYQKKNSEGTHYFECIRYSDFNIHAHMHRHPEILFVRQGSIAIESAAGMEIINENEFAFIMSNEMHSYSTESSSLVDICIFSSDYVPMVVNQIRGKKADRTKFVCRDSVLRYVSQELFVTDLTPDSHILKCVLVQLSHLPELNHHNLNLMSYKMNQAYFSNHESHFQHWHDVQSIWLCPNL